MLDEASTAQGDLGPIKQVENAPYISMNDGEINGNAGCNAFAGTYEVRASSAIVFEDVFMELKGCDPVSNAYDLLFGEVFGGEVDLRMDSDSMIWTAAGNELRFVRSSAEDN
jgi:heat shock protein HslJ